VRVSRPDAERVFGAALVADALADVAPVPVTGPTFNALVRLFTEHARDDLPTFRLVTLAWLSSLEPAVARAVVRVVVGGVAEALADVERDERRSRMH
jgi:hypothetical protein